MVVVAIAVVVGLAVGLVLGLVTKSRSGSWCPQCGDHKRCLRDHHAGGSRP